MNPNSQFTNQSITQWAWFHKLLKYVPLLCSMLNMCIKIGRWAILEGEMFFKQGFISLKFSPCVSFTCFEEGRVWRKEGELKPEGLWRSKSSLLKVFPWHEGLGELPVRALRDSGSQWGAQGQKGGKKNHCSCKVRGETPWKEQEAPQHPLWSWRDGWKGKGVSSTPSELHWLQQGRTELTFDISVSPAFIFLSVFLIEMPRDCSSQLSPAACWDDLQRR